MEFLRDAQCTACAMATAALQMPWGSAPAQMPRRGRRLLLFNAKCPAQILGTVTPCPHLYFSGANPPKLQGWTCGQEFYHPNQSDWSKDGHVTQAGPMRVSHGILTKTFRKEVFFFYWGCQANWKLGTAGNHVFNHKIRVCLRMKQLQRRAEQIDEERNSWW